MRKYQRRRLEMGERYEVRKGTSIVTIEIIRHDLSRHVVTFEILGKGVNRTMPDAEVPWFIEHGYWKPVNVSPTT
jgi:hypothetical protein